jgi:2-dehydro-3-deoxy-D-gluconate 5-dehydrogenase
MSINRLFDLKGRIAIVTGGNGGLGLGMSLGLAGAGATVVIAARQESKSRDAAVRLRKLNPACDSIVLDVCSQDSCRSAIDEVAARFGRLDILVNNSGISVRKAPEALTEADWASVLDTNLSGVFRCAQAAYRHMKSSGGGKIINVGSMYSLFGAPMVAAYAASKGGVVQLTRSLATAWAPDNIQVNAIVPGWLDTELTRSARVQVAGLHDSVLQRTPAGRWGTPDDMAGAAVFLAADASNFVTGAALPVDGGYSIRG